MTTTKPCPWCKRIEIPVAASWCPACNERLGHAIAAGAGLLALLLIACFAVWRFTSWRERTASPPSPRAEQQSQPEPSREPDVSDALKAAAWVIDHTVPSPSTTTYLKVLDLGGDSAGHHVVFVQFDSPNTYGVLIRQNVCVAFTIGEKRVTWQRSAALFPCNDPPTDADLVRVFLANGWGKESGGREKTGKATDWQRPLKKKQ